MDGKAEPAVTAGAVEGGCPFIRCPCQAQQSTRQGVVILAANDVMNAAVGIRSLKHGFYGH